MTRGRRKERIIQRSTYKDPALGLGRQVQGTQKMARMAATQWDNVK